MKILYISSVPSNKQFIYMKSKLKKNVDNAKYGMQESGYKFHHLIMEGIISDKQNEIYSLVGRPTSFKKYQNIIWKKELENESSITYEHIGFLNLPIIKNLIVSLKYFFKTLKWIKINKNEEKCIIVDAAYVTVLPFINLATKIRKCSKVAIVCDIYEYMAPVKDARKNSNKIHKIISKYMKKQYEKIDGFVFLTEAMNNVLNSNNKPYIIMEGLVDFKMQTKDNNLVDKLKKDVIIYAGALREQYGLKNLVDGFTLYKNSNAELRIYGAGDYALEIEKKAKIDNRIKYMGMVSNEKVVDDERKATILINPRSADQEFTKYSFPSKNMEYMVSGTPLLTTKLPGMPKEYYDYIYTIDGNTSNDITIALEKSLSLSKKVLHEKGLSARNFVLQNKNNHKQAQRIIELCKVVNSSEKN